VLADKLISIIYIGLERKPKPRKWRKAGVGGEVMGDGDGEAETGKWRENSAGRGRERIRNPDRGGDSWRLGGREQRQLKE
jgi:hypothetical protein